MADISDVETALVALIVAALYPTGVSGPTAASVAGPICKVYRGWPGPAALDADLMAGIVNVSVFSQPNVERNTTRYDPNEWQQITAAAPKITIAVAGNQVTLGGTIQAGDAATVKIGPHWYAVAVQSNSTLSGLASALAALIAVNFAGANAAGGVITVPTSATITVSASGAGTAAREIGRQQRGFQITCWCPTPATRDLVAPVVDVALRDLRRTTLIDQSVAHVFYNKTWITDKGQTDQSYRRDLFYTIEYATTVSAASPSIGAVQEVVSGGISPADTPTPITPTI